MAPAISYPVTAFHNAASRERAALEAAYRAAWDGEASL